MNNKLVQFFENAYQNKRLSHLYLLSGDVGAGKLKLAYDVAYIILKDFDNRTNLKDLIESNNHSQIHLIRPDSNVIKKNQIIALQDEFSKTSLLNIPRIYIIENIDLISSAAANSLLKFMEEPDNKNVYGILITSNIQQVLPTIISRSQVIRVVNNNELQLIEKLVNNDVDLYVATNIIHLTKDFNKALEYKDNYNVLTIIEFLKNYFINFNNFNYYPNLIIEQNLSFILYDRIYYEMFLELLLIHYLDLLKEKLKQEVIFKQLEETYNKINIKTSKESILESINLIQNEIIKQNYYINISLSIEQLLLKLKRR